MFANYVKANLDNILAVLGGILLLLVLFKGECITVSDKLSHILLAVETFIGFISSPFREFANLLLLYLEFPKPESDTWEKIFALSIFHQMRTFHFEYGIRRNETVTAMVVCFLLGGTVSYALGAHFKLSNPSIAVFAIACLYPSLEFVRYSIYALFRRGTDGDFTHHFKRMHRIYTFRYLIASVIAAVISWLLFRGTDLVIPIFASLLFLSLAIYLLCLEYNTQRRRKNRQEQDVSFWESTVTKTAIQFIGIIGGAFIVLVVDQRSWLLNTLWACVTAS